MTLTQEHVDNTISEEDTHRWCCEASDLGLRPGEWPETIPTSKGNGRPFIRTSKKVNDDNDLLWVTYWQQLGCLRLQVFND